MGGSRYTLQLLLLWVVSAFGYIDGVQSSCDGSSSNCKVEDELSLMQIKTEAFQRENAHKESGSATGSDFILVEWNMQMAKVQKDGRYLFLKNRWWPWFSNKHKDKTVLLHISGCQLRDYAPQLISGMIGGTIKDLFAGDSVAIDPNAITTPPAYSMEVLHRCEGDGVFGGKMWLSNKKSLYSSSGSSCKKMYNKTNITDPPHSIKFGGKHVYALDSGKDTLLAARMFRNAVTGVMASGHDSDILLGSWNIDPTDSALRHIYDGIPSSLNLHKSTQSGSGASNLVYGVDHAGKEYKLTCIECPGKPSAQNVTDYLVSGPKLSITALPSFKDEVMFNTWKNLGHNAPLDPPTTASSNMFPAIDITRGVHVPLVYLVSSSIPPPAPGKPAPPKHGPIKVKRSPGAHKPAMFASEK